MLFNAVNENGTCGSQICALQDMKKGDVAPCRGAWVETLCSSRQSHKDCLRVRGREALISLPGCVAVYPRHQRTNDCQLPASILERRPSFLGAAGSFFEPLTKLEALKVVGLVSEIAVPLTMSDER